MFRSTNRKIRPTRRIISVSFVYIRENDALTSSHLVCTNLPKKLLILHEPIYIQAVKNVESIIKLLKLRIHWNIFIIKKSIIFVRIYVRIFIKFLINGYSLLFSRYFSRIVARFAKMAVFIAGNYRRDGFVSSWSTNAFGLLRAFTPEIREERFLSFSFLPPRLRGKKWRKRAVNVLREETFVEVMYPHTPPFRE